MIGKIDSKHLQVGEIDIHYYTAGHGDPLLIIHGGGDGARSWLKTVTWLSRNYRIYAPDLPGFGLSQPIGRDQDIPKYVEFAEEFSRILGLQRFHLVGHSLGGAIALHYALAYPHKVDKLVLVSSMYLRADIAPWVSFMSSPFFYKSLAAPAHAFMAFVKRLVDLFYSPKEFINPLPRAKIDMAKLIMALQEQTTALTDQLSELIMPTLLVWGAKDSIVPVSHAYAAVQIIPDCHLEVLEGCGHNVYKEKAGRFSRLVAGFLGQKKAA